MKNLKDIISEKLIINSKTKIISKKSFTDEELRDDYTNVWACTTKKEKQEYAIKYHSSVIKIRDIQIIILDYLRENRFNKKNYDDNDFRDFFRYDLPEKYDKFKEYLDKEPLKFVEALYERYLKRNKKIHNKIALSISDKHQLKRENQLKQYLNK